MTLLQAHLAPASPTAAPAVERAHAPSRRDFLENWLRPGRPVLLTGLMEDWPAYRRWTPEFFKARGAGRRARVEFNNVLQDSPLFREEDLGKYLAGLGEPREDGAAPYLAYFDLFRYFPDLRREVRFDYWKGRIQIPIGWIGPAGTYTGLHYDVGHNLFAQFHGAKRFTLYDPDQGAFLYPARRYDPGSVQSEVDGRNPDYARHPLFRKARGASVRVEAGEILFTPRGWWHEVAGLETSISVSCFGFGAKDALLYAAPAWMRQTLHKAGLYRRGDCACHREKEGI